MAAHPFANLESPTQSGGADARVHATVFKPKSSEVTLAMLTKAHDPQSSVTGFHIIVDAGWEA